jgi:hypothetical protein
MSSARGAVLAHEDISLDGDVDACAAKDSISLGRLAIATKAGLACRNGASEGRGHGGDPMT